MPNVANPDVSQTPSGPSQTRVQSPQWLGLLLVLGVTVAAFWGVTKNGFVDYDDGDYVYENRQVQAGLSSRTVIWAFTTAHASNWHPLTWLSHAADCAWFGLDPGRHHLVSLCIHLLNTVLVFALARRFVGADSQALVVAGLFALHPMHVESVAWLSERKDLLSTFFGLLTLLCYHRYQSKQPAGKWYFASLGFFCLSLLSKPMMVTLPFLLLLLDYWPFRRLQVGRPLPWKWLFIEKLPFLALTTVSCVVTYLVQRNSTVMSMEALGIGARLANVLVAYVVYLRKLVWPVDLAFFYPLTPRSAWQVSLAGTILLAITLGVWRRRHSHPYEIVGWLWFLGTLVPVIGFVQVGEQGLADRYTYFPSLGPFLIIGEWGRAWLSRKPHHAASWTGAAVVVLLTCASVTWRQVQHWKDSRTLLDRALAVTQENFLAHNNLGYILARDGDISAAWRHFQEALRIKPNYGRAHRNLAAVLVRQGDLQKAEEQYQEALRLNPADAEALHQLGTLLVRKGDLDQAVGYCRRAVIYAPEDTSALYDYGLVLNLKGRHREAVAPLSRSLELKQDHLTLFQLGLTFASLGQANEAAKHFQNALRLRPDWPEALSELAWLLATTDQSDLRNPAHAIALAEKANELTEGGRYAVLRSLAAAYAAGGRFQEAANTAERAILLAEKAGRKDAADQVRKALEFYRTGLKPGT